MFEAGIECSSKTMYPDWLSLTGEGYVASMYKKYGAVISPMGCRAFLSPWFERGGMEPADGNDKPVFVGRFNIGAVSLHLPLILAKSRKEGRDFYEVLDYYLELIRRLHIRTYAYLGEMRASTNRWPTARVVSTAAIWGCMTRSSRCSRRRPLRSAIPRSMSFRSFTTARASMRTANSLWM